MSVDSTALYGSLVAQNTSTVLCSIFLLLLFQFQADDGMMSVPCDSAASDFTVNRAHL